MTKDQAKIIRLLVKIQNECGKINFNTNIGVSFIFDSRYIELVVDYSTLIEIDYNDIDDYKFVLSKLKPALKELKKCRKMNRIIVKKGES